MGTRPEGERGGEMKGGGRKGARKRARKTLILNLYPYDLATL